jgi:hypothetical protein
MLLLTTRTNQTDLQGSLGQHILRGVSYGFDRGGSLCTHALEPLAPPPAFSTGEAKPTHLMARKILLRATRAELALRVRQVINTTRGETARVSRTPMAPASSYRFDGLNRMCSIGESIAALNVIVPVPRLVLPIGPAATARSHPSRRRHYEYRSRSCLEARERNAEFLWDNERY